MISSMQIESSCCFEFLSSLSDDDNNRHCSNDESFSMMIITMRMSDVSAILRRRRGKR